jgi:predicted GNAT superfamily acetyltransferase
VDREQATDVRSILPPDLPALVLLNNAHAQELSLVSEEGLRALIAAAALARASGVVGAPDAFLLAFDEATKPQGPNHAWFLARLAKFLYVDRGCVAPPAAPTWTGEDTL